MNAFCLWVYSTVIDADVINQAGEKTGWIKIVAGTKVQPAI